MQLLNSRLVVGRFNELASGLEDSLQKGCASVFFCNVHMLMLAQEDQELALAMDGASLVFPDGMPIAWLQRRLGFPEADVLRGEVATDLVCRHAARDSLSVGFFGSTSTVLTHLSENVLDRYPDLNIHFMSAPPEIRGEIVVDPALLDEINSRHLFCLFVGLGCPKQEKWALAYGPQLNCNILAVGAVFDWLAGTTRQPPGWTVRWGLAWLYRLLENPRKLWYRYMKYNTKFVVKSVGLLFKQSRSRRPPEISSE
jgi:N-acetylglucosaminyldiphosphoundecaprenol N-acetyl-beta-D-mannosaminyltransferase